MSTYMLREAAQRLRALAVAWGSEPWTPEAGGTLTEHTLTTSRPIYCHHVRAGSKILSWAGSADEAKAKARAEYVATMNPMLALALAELLEKAADDVPPDPHPETYPCFECNHYYSSVNIARRILDHEAAS
jgi:hypothetical protein